MQIDAAGSQKPESFEPRYLGDHLLVAQLGHDVLGTVFRALDSADEKRFVRLRVLQSGELDPQAVLAAIGKSEKAPALINPAIVKGARFGVTDGIPFLAWCESGGWTLDTILSRVRALKLQISTEHALLVAERVSEALEHAHLTLHDGESVHHGILWPGFVSISNDANVRIGGFGLAEAVLPSLHKPRLSNEIAPYVAPEARELGIVGDSSDVYSLGVLLLELLTSRRPALTVHLSDPRATDSFSKEISAFLRRCLAPPSQRFRSAVEMRRVLQELLAGSPHLLSAPSFALFLYRLLNPESRSALPSADAEATNPVTVESAARAPIFEMVSPPSAAPRELREDAPAPHGLDAESQAETPWGGRLAAAALVALAIAGGAFLLTGSRPAPEQRGEPGKETVAASEVGMPGESTVAAPAPAGAENAVLALEPPRQKAPPPERDRTVRSSGRAVLRESTRAADASARNSRFEPGLLRAAAASARHSRFQAGLARVEAERLDARDLAADLFGEAVESEQEGDRLVRESDYDAAQLAFRRAAESFRMAESASREERVRQVRLDSP
jgi:serine/threonine protein kinase